MSRGTNSAWERNLASTRALVTADPDEATARAARLLEDAQTDGERLRAALTIARVELAKDQPERFHEQLDRAANRYGSADPVARSELARYHLYEQDLESAARAADLAVSLLEPLASESPKYRRWYDAAEVVPQTAFAAALITRAEVRQYQGSPAEALSDVLRGLSWVDPRFSPKVHVAGLAALGRILIEPASPRRGSRTTS